MRREIGLGRGVAFSLSSVAMLLASLAVLLCKKDDLLAIDMDIGRGLVAAFIRAFTAFAPIRSGLVVPLLSGVGADGRGLRAIVAVREASERRYFFTVEGG